jgi:hypothetical protein
VGIGIGTLTRGAARRREAIQRDGSARMMEITWAAAARALNANAAEPIRARSYKNRNFGFAVRILSM